MLLLGGYLGDMYGHTKTHQVKGRLARVDANLMYLHSDHPPCQKLPLRSSCSHRDIKRRTIFCAGLYSVIRLTAGLKPISNGEDRAMRSSRAAKVTLQVSAGVRSPWGDDVAGGAA